MNNVLCWLGRAAGHGARGSILPAPVSSVGANVDAVVPGGKVIINSFNGMRTMRAIEGAEAHRTG